MSRSPIQTMVDQACGFDPNAPLPKLEENLEPEAQCLLDIADAAKEWRRNKRGSKAKLRAAVLAFERLGG